MKKPIIILCCAILCIAACSKNNTPAPANPITNTDTTDTSVNAIDTTTQVTVSRYYGTGKSTISIIGNPESDTSFADSAFVTITIKGTDTTTEFKHHTSPEQPYWTTKSLKGYRLGYSNGDRYSYQMYSVHSDTLHINWANGSTGASFKYRFEGKKQ